MSRSQWWADAHRLLSGPGSRGKVFAAAAIAFVAAATGVLFALPLTQRVDTFVSRTTFIGLLLVLSAIAVVRRVHATGGARVAWMLFAVTFAATAVVFVLDPQEAEGDLTFALDGAVVPALGFWIAVIVLSAPALPGLASLRSAADALWISTTVIVAVWPTMIEPVRRLDTSSGLVHALHLGFALTTILLCTTVLVTLPSIGGRGRIGLWFLGSGGAFASAAGLFHIRFYYEGTHRYGSGWDYLWIVGLASLALASLVAGEGDITPRPRGIRWHAGITVFPLGVASVALLSGEQGPAHLVGAVVLLAALSLRVLALLAENDRLNLSLAADARRDPLTGLGNRRALASGMHHIGERAAAGGRLRAVVVIDLDHFKQVNDTHGHLVGDEVLKIVARRLRDVVRDRDTIVRHGGDEFVAVMSVRDEADARQAAARIRDAVKGDYVTPSGTLTIGATMGVAVDAGAAPLDAVLAIADAALYAAKARGRGTIHLEMSGSI